MTSPPEQPGERERWPWRPREGYPSVPAWLLIVVIAIIVLAGIILLSQFGSSGNA